MTVLKTFSFEIFTLFPGEWYSKINLWPKNEDKLLKMAIFWEEAQLANKRHSVKKMLGLPDEMIDCNDDNGDTIRYDKLFHLIRFIEH